MKRKNHLATLTQWAEWGKALARPRSYQPDWSAVEALMETAEPRLQEDSETLRKLLEQSRDRLKSSDPFLGDLGVHRWLAADREEAYSDWLAWVLERLNDANAVLRVLGVEKTEFVAVCTGQGYRVEREASVTEGDPGSGGRVDVVIGFGEPEIAALGVEVKTWDENHKKQRGYLQSLRKACPNHQAECVLVANKDVPPDCRHGFEPQTWEDLSVALRQAIAEVVQSRGVDATSSMMLGFVGAIEQNLLGYGVAACRRAWQHKLTLLPKGVCQHLQKSLEIKQ